MNGLALSYAIDWRVVLRGVEAKNRELAQLRAAVPALVRSLARCLGVDAEGTGPE